MHAVIPLLILALAAPDAEKLIKKGVELRKKRQDAEALELFRQAHDLDPTARSLAQIALAEQALGKWLEAEAHLREALARTTDPWIRSNLHPLQKAAAEIAEHLATIAIRNAPEGASIRLGDSPPKPGPFAETRVLCDIPVHIAATAPGYLPSKRTLTPACGKKEIIALRMEKEPPALDRVAPSTEQPREPAREAPASIAVHTPPADETTPLSTYGYIAGGGAVLGFGAGVIGLVVREGHAKKYNDDALCLPPNGLTRDQNCRNEREAAKTAQLLSITSLAAATALTAAAITFFVLDEPNPDPTTSAKTNPQPTLTCGPTFATPGLACIGLFD
jgi:tetratricopeptide (TPR) repeat protein